MTTLFHVGLCTLYAGAFVAIVSALLMLAILVFHDGDDFPDPPRQAFKGLFFGLLFMFLGMVLALGGVGGSQ